jgi:carboxymethylenebutenolidase
LGEIAVPTPAGPLPAYLAQPGAANPEARPGVVVVHELFGLTDDIRRWCDRFAAEGYTALAPDLLHWGASLRCLMAAFRALRSGRGRALTEIEACRDHLAALPDASGRVGIAGFCMGGGFALLAAPRGFAAAAPNYAPLPRDPQTALRGACPIVASYGARDRGLRGAAGTLESALERLGVEHDVKEYAAASHSFLNDHEGWMGATDLVTGFRHHEAAADDAWRRIRGFFAAHLRPGAT